MGDIDSTLNVSLFDDISLATANVQVLDTTAKGINSVPLGKSTGTFYPLQTANILTVNQTYPIRTNADGIQEIRSAVLTDEGSFYDSFAGVALGAGWTIVAGAGTSYSVSNSQLTVNSGTTANSEIVISVPLDYPPVKFYADCALSQRISNCDVYLELTDNATSGSETEYARFHFTGTTNTQILCETQSHAGGGGQQSYSAIVPNTSSSKDWIITVSGEQVSFLTSPDTPVNIQSLVQFTDEIPDPYKKLYLRIRIKNGAIAPVSNTVLTLDLVRVTNYDKIEIGSTSKGEPIETELLAFDNLVTRTVRCDTTGRLLVSQAFAAQTVNLSYDASISPLVANMWLNLVKYTVPTGYNFEIVEFNTLTANANASFRFTKVLNMGAFNLTGSVFTDGSAFSLPGFASNVEAEITTAFTGTAVTFTITYTNELGVTGHTGTITTTAAPGVGQRFAMVLAAGDFGVSDITNVTKAGGTAGICTFYGIVELLWEKNSTTDQTFPRLTSRQSIILAPGDQLQMDIQHSTTTSIRRAMKVVGLLTSS